MIHTHTQTHMRTYIDAGTHISIKGGINEIRLSLHLALSLLLSLSFSRTRARALSLILSRSLSHSLSDTSEGETGSLHHIRPRKEPSE